MLTSAISKQFSWFYLRFSYKTLFIFEKFSMRKPSFFFLFVLCHCCFLCCNVTEIKQSELQKITTVTTYPFFYADIGRYDTDSSQPPLILTFAGDLMAHTVNFNMKQYDLIYKDVEKILHNDDLSFINVETPICDALPLSTYPSFNVHTSYLRAAAAAGFDVFSFANNHTNDHRIVGIDGTLTAARTVQEERKAADTPPYLLAYSGLKEQVGEPIQITQICYKGWNILFCAVTEILNSYDSSKERLYYSAPTKQGRAALLTAIQNARKRYPCDLFILGLHLNEPEYIRTVSEQKKAWFRRLGEAGVDIMWAHHPHVMQPWETITVKRPVSAEASVRNHAEHADPGIPALKKCLTATAAGDSVSSENNPTKPPFKPMEHRSVFCMYSMGNFISGQRWHVNYEDPAYYREYTGDAVLLQLQCTRTPNGNIDFKTVPILITQYNQATYPVVKQFTPAWLQTLNEKEQQYFNRRFTLMKAYLPF